MPTSLRVLAVKAALLITLAVLVGAVVAVMTTHPHREFQPGVHPTGPVGSGLHLPPATPDKLRVDWPSGLGLIGNTGARNTGGAR